MIEEMRRDHSVFLMGEEVAQYQGAYKVSQGLLEEFGAGRVIDTPITEHGFAGLGVGAAFGGLAAHRRIHDLELRHAGDRPDHQLRRQDAATCRAGRCTVPSCSAGRTAAARVGAQHSQDYSSWYAHVPGLKVIAPYFAADAKALLKSRDPRSQPRRVFGKRNSLRPFVPGSPSSTITSCRSARRAW